MNKEFSPLPFLKTDGQWERAGWVVYKVHMCISFVHGGLGWMEALIYISYIFTLSSEVCSLPRAAISLSLSHALSLSHTYTPSHTHNYTHTHLHCVRLSASVLLSLNCQMCKYKPCFQ